MVDPRVIGRNSNAKAEEIRETSIMRERLTFLQSLPMLFPLST